jgi:hypothetical protein
MALQRAVLSFCAAMTALLPFIIPSPTDACVACPVAFSLIAVPAEKPTVITKSAHCDLRFRGVRA